MGQRTIASAMAALTLACSACRDGAPPDAEPLEPAGMAPQTFEIFLEDAPTADTVIPQIVAAAHERLATACADRSSVLVRIWNPLIPGSYTDVPCTEILGTGTAVSEAGKALAREPTGEARGEWSPVGLVCSLLMFGAASAFNWPWAKEGCNNPRANDPAACQAATGLGFGALGVLCSLI